MCLEDVKIGRASPGSSGSASISSGAASLLLQGNARRFSLVLSPPLGHAVTIGFGRVPSGTGDGLLLNSNSSPIMLTLQDVGQVITLPLYAILDAAGPLLVGFVEGVLDETAL